MSVAPIANDEAIIGLHRTPTVNKDSGEVNRDSDGKGIKKHVGIGMIIHMPEWLSKESFFIQQRLWATSPRSESRSMK
jgi:hypothetical protein